MKRFFYLQMLLLLFFYNITPAQIIPIEDDNNLYYRDNDGDGYGDPNIEIPFKRDGYVLNNLDCNDNDKTINPSTLWYADSDADNFGNPKSSIRSCLRPDGYIRNNTDKCPTVYGRYDGCPSPENSNVALSNENYIYETLYLNAFTEDQLSDVQDKDKLQNVVYLDELGRPKQKILIQQSPSNKDIITHIEYDGFGRSTKTYLPFPSSQHNGSFFNNIKSETETYYNSEFNEPTYYSEKKYSDETFNIVEEQGAPGNTWAITSQGVNNVYENTNVSIGYISRFTDYSLNEEKSHKIGYIKNDILNIDIKIVFDEENTLVDYVLPLEYFLYLPEGPEINGIKELGRVKDSNWNDSSYKIRFANGNFELVNTESVKTESKEFYISINYDLTNAIKTESIHSIKFDYSSNQESDNVRLFGVSFVDNEKSKPQLIEKGFYEKGSLTKSIIKDENWQISDGLNRTVEEFRNKAGEVVLKRAYNNSQQHNTYYIYDDYGNLTYVIPPKGSDNQEITQNVLDKLCYQYKYDSRNRLVVKKIPGKGKEFIVYDVLNRPVLTQDANLQAQGIWMFTKYDVLGRVIYTGKYTDSRDRVALSAVFSSRLRGAEANYEHKLTNNITSNLGIEYSNDDFPNDASKIEVLAVNYYDNYEFNGAPFNPALNPETIFNDQETTSKTISLETGSKVKVLETDDWVTTVTYYDEKARPIYVHTKNSFLNTIDFVKTDLDFVGKALRTRTSHKKDDNEEIVTLNTFTYDRTGRLLKQVQCIGNSSLPNDCGSNGAVRKKIVIDKVIDPDISKTIIATESVTLLDGFHAKPVTGNSVEIKIDDKAIGIDAVELIAENNYDQLGKLIQRNVGNTETEPLQKIAYNYNIRGWLKSINADTDTNDNDLFNFEIKYNDIADETKQLFNGNISQTLWSTQSINTTDNTVSTEYTYTYDDLNRIKSAIDNTNHYNLTDITYDKNGNIESLQRQGNITEAPTNNSGFGLMDNLSYLYDEGNKLLSVTEQAGASTSFGFKDGNTIGNDYVYDANGNLISDANKQISSIKYNHLNMPTKVTVTGANVGVLEFKYAADGTKLRKIKTQSGNTTTTDYASGYIYENNILKQFVHSEGYVTKEANGFRYVYNYVDHLGTVRLAYSDLDGNGTITPSSEILLELNTYPFGLEHLGYNSAIAEDNNYQTYLGQELQKELGLNWHSYKWRNADPSLGRFFGSDPIAEDYYYQTNYQFASNNPVWKVEIEGLEGEKTNNGTDIQDEYSEAILNKDILFSRNYGWVDYTHAFTNTKRDDPYIGVESLWDQLKNEPKKEQIYLGYYSVNYKQDVKIAGISIGIERQYLVKPGLSLEERKSVALSIFQDVSMRFEALQGLHPTSGSSFEPADLPSNMISFYRTVEGYTESQLSKILDFVEPSQAIEVYNAYPGTFTDKKYKNYSFSPKRFESKYTSENFGIPSELNTIKPMNIGTMWDFGKSNLLFREEDIIKF